MIMQTLDDRRKKDNVPFERGAPKFKERNMEISALYAMDYTYTQIARHYGLCPQRISQIVAQEEQNQRNGFRSRKKQSV